MELNELVTEVKSGLEAFKNDANKTIGEQKTALDALREQVENLGKLDGVAKAADVEQIRKDFDELAMKFNEGGSGEKKDQNFKGSFAKGIEAIKDDLSGLAKKGGKVDKTIELKDMDFDNFSTEALDILTSQTLPGVYANPWSQLWLRGIFPSASTTSSTIKYIQEDNEANESNGAADIWDGSLPIAELINKPDVDFSFTDASADVYWIAGITRIKREMLDDISFLRSYIPQQLVYGKRGIFIRENTMILANLANNSVSYDGSKSILIEQLIDAAYGQLLDNYHAPTHILMNHREALEIVFNKATTSGEHDLPAGVQVTPLGQLTIGGVPVIGLPQFAAGTAFVLDARQSLFVSRMEPEVRAFEQDRDNVPKNLITFRAEERATHLVFDPTSVVRVEQGT